MFKTKVVTRDTDVTVNVFYKHSRIKQYLKDGRALRIETVVNSPDDLGAATAAWSICPNCKPRPVTSTADCSILNVSGRAVSLRAQPLSGSRSPPSPRMAGGPRPCGSATLGSWPWPAPCVSPHRPRIHQPEPACPGEPSAGHRLQRQPDELRPRADCASTGSSNDARTATPTTSPPTGQRVAIFYTKVHNRLLRPLLAADKPPAPLPLRRALSTIDQHVRGYIDDARMVNAA